MQTTKHLPGLQIDRRQHETVVIHGPCMVVVERIHEARVKLRIVADPSVQIVRGDAKRLDRQPPKA